MAHQILGLRPHFSNKQQKWIQSDADFFARKWNVNFLATLFKNPQKVLDDNKVPTNERWNLFYHVPHSGEKKRQFQSQDVMVFDIDNVDHAQTDTYVALINFVLGTIPAKTAVINSGHGLHFIIWLKKAFTDESYFSDHRHYYRAVCDKLMAEMKRKNLPFKNVDPVFDGGRLLRVPGTLNRKEGKPEKPCFVVQGHLEPQDWNLIEASGLPVVDRSEQLGDRKEYYNPDQDGVLKGCEFLKWCGANQAEVSESQWYAMLSVIPRLSIKGRLIAHEYSKAHPGYSYDETESKIDQALAASGPRTCANINSLWGGCGGCKQHGKVKSPISIRGETFILTENTGFWTYAPDKNGLFKPVKPCYEDLRRFFEKERPYLSSKKICFQYNGTHYDEVDDEVLENFAQTHFEPAADTKMVTEFKNLVHRTQLKDRRFFNDTTFQRVNLRNGILDLQTMKLLPHTKDYGFRYRLDYDYDPDARAPLFEAFLLQIMNNSHEMADLILEFMGYAFSNDSCWAEKALIMEGAGANGKSTLINIMKAVAGAGNYSTITLNDIKHANARRMLEGKLFNLAEETPSHSMMESSMFKNLVSGGESLARALYKNQYTFINRCKFAFASNIPLETNDRTKGFRRKLLIVPFNVTFDEGEQAKNKKDPFLKDKLLSELAGILNLLLKAYHNLKARGRFAENKILVDTMADFQLDIDPVRRWVRDCLLIEPLDESKNQRETSGTELYASYQSYALAHGEKPESAIKVFQQLMPLIKEKFDGDAARRRHRHRHQSGPRKGERDTFYIGVLLDDAAPY